MYRWRLATNQPWDSASIPDLMAEFMRVRFQIQDRRVTLMDILNTMISPADPDKALVANGVRENSKACSSTSLKRRKRQAGRNKRL